MGRPPLRVYEQGSAPRAAGITQARNVDLGQASSGIGAALSRAGRTIDAVAEQDLQIELMQRQREEDDARVYAAQNMAEVRRRANELRRTTFQNAPDGWRDATTGVATGYRAIADEALNSAPTPAAREFMYRSTSLFEQELLDSTAEQEQTARQGWRVDGVNTAIDTSSSVLAADPGQYQAVRGEQIELIRTMTDLSPDQRRDLEAKAEETFAVSAVSGMVDANPYSALRSLRDPEEGSPVSRLTGPQRSSMINRAQAEINRREAIAREGRNQAIASLRDAVSAQRDNMRRTGVPPNQPLDIGQISTLLGPDVAQAYLGDLQGVSVSQEVAGWPMSRVAQVAAGRVVAGEGEDVERLLSAEARTSSTSSLEARAQDPGNFTLRNGLMRDGQLLGRLHQAMNGGGAGPLWDAFDNALRERAADAVALYRRGVVPRVAPLSQQEARALARDLEQLEESSQLAFFSRAQRAMNSDAYAAMMGQLAEEGTGVGAITAFAGHVYGRGAGQGEAVARTLLRGSAVLQGGTPNSQGGRSQPGARSTPFDMPSEEEMRMAWTQYTGHAYDRMPSRAADLAYQAFRTYYAGVAQPSGTSGTINQRFAREAVEAATGGLIEWGNRDTVKPWGMTDDEFTANVRREFDRHPYLNGLTRNPITFGLQAAGGGEYFVMNGNTPLLTPGGDVVSININAPDRPSRSRGYQGTPVAVPLSGDDAGRHAVSVGMLGRPTEPE